jgi:hypothetical protein
MTPKVDAGAGPMRQCVCPLLGDMRTTGHGLELANLGQHAHPTWRTELSHQVRQHESGVTNRAVLVPEAELDTTQVLATLSNKDVSGWTRYEYDLSAFKGKVVELKFTAAGTSRRLSD